MSLPAELTKDGLLDAWEAAAKARGADPGKLAADQAVALAETAEAVAGALDGDADQQADLEAIFLLNRFCTNADAFIEANAWAHALVDVLLAIVKAGAQLGAAAAATALAGALNKGAER